MYTQALQSIFDAQIPTVHDPHLRLAPRKMWAAEVRKLFKSLNIAGVSVRTPNYANASGIDIRIPHAESGILHEAEHTQIELRERASGTWLGFGHYCPFCKEHYQAHEKITAIVLAAFPDLDDRSDTQSDYFDFCFIVE